MSWCSACAEPLAPLQNLGWQRPFRQWPRERYIQRWRSIYLIATAAWDAVSWNGSQPKVHRKREVKTDHSVSLLAAALKT